ncbi:unnamed protein product, partial [marine sediment metagenome]
DYIILVDTSDERREIFLKNKNFPDDDIESSILYTVSFIYT